MSDPVAVNSLDGPVANMDIDLFCDQIRDLLASGQSEEALYLTEREVERIRDEVDHRAEAKACLMQALAHAACYPGDSFGTAEIAQTSAEAFRVLDETDGEMEASKLVVQAHLEAKNAEEATRTAETLLNRCRQLGYQAGGAWSMAALAEAALMDGRVEDARESLKHATKMYKDAQDSTGEAQCQIIACNVALASDENEDAVEAAVKAYEICDKINDKKGIAKANIRLAAAYSASGQHIEALRAIEEADKIALGCGDKAIPVEASLAEVAAKIAICEPRPTTSENVSNVSLHILKLANAACANVMSTKKHDHIAVGDAHYLQAQSMFIMGSFKGAEVAIKTAAKAYRKGRDVRKRAKAIVLWAEVEVQRGYLQDARIEARRAQDLYEQLGDDEGLSKVARVYDLIDKALGIPTQAELEEQQRKALLMLQQQQQQQQQGWAPPPNLPVMEAPPEDADHGHGAITLGSREGGPLILSAGVTSAQITGRIITIVSQILGDDGEDNIEVDLPLMEVGISSNKATILRDELSKDIPGVKLPATLVFDYPSVTDITLFIADKSGVVAG